MPPFDSCAPMEKFKQADEFDQHHNGHLTLLIIKYSFNTQTLLQNYLLHSSGADPSYFLFHGNHRKLEDSCCIANHLPLSDDGYPGMEKTRPQTPSFLGWLDQVWHSLHPRQPISVCIVSTYVGEKKTPEALFHFKCFAKVMNIKNLYTSDMDHNQTTFFARNSSF